MRYLFWLVVCLSLMLPPLPLAAAAASPAPTLLAPADATLATAAAHPPLGIPEFRWSRIGGATSYRIQFSQDVAFTTRVEATTANTSYTPTDASKFADGLWYWRVRAESPAPAGDYSEIWAFTKQWASPGNAPVLVAPAADATLGFYDRPTFSWQTVMGAASYKFQISASADCFAAPRYSQITLAPTHQPSAKLANGVYYWRVIPLDAVARDGTPSEVRAFTANYNLTPTPLEPDDMATPSFTPTLRWTAVRGAQYYRVQYSTDPTFNTGVVSVDSRNTAYTPTSDLPNDVNYNWRVRAYSGASISDWSPPRTFVKRWYIQPQLLTPVNNAQYVRDPFFSWTPVPAASYYKVEVNTANSFPPTVQGWTATTANPFWVRPDFDRSVSPRTWYWRVTPVDRAANAGQPSEVFSFVYNGTALAAQQIHPLFYYEPSPLLRPREDRAVAWPLFMWHRITYLTTQVAAYRVQVDDDPLFGSVNWTFDTQNLSAAPTVDRPFAPVSGRDYFWRVRPLDAMEGNEIGQWSQIWKACFDASKALSPTVGTAPILLRPAAAAEYVETSPLLEWQPLQDADSYEVQISSDQAFSPAYIVKSAIVPYPAYTPQARLAYGTYYWRVIGRRGGAAVGDWSAAWRFQAAAQSHWVEPRTLGSSANRMLIGFDPAGDMQDPNFDLTTLYAVQSKDYWFFGFNATATATDMAYVLYLDLDHLDDSGAAGDARGYNVTTIAAHRPEYAVYVLQNSGIFTASQVVIYRWTEAGWATPQRLDEVGGALHYDLPARHLELRLPNTVIGMQENTGSAAVALFSALSSGGHAQDTAPADPGVMYTAPDIGPDTTVLSRFSSVSERMTPALPANNATGDPTVLPSAPPFLWHLPVDVPVYGYNLQAAVDPRFTSPILDYTLRANLAAYTPAHYTYNRDFNGDNSYYWRVRPVYDPTGNMRGAWSQPWRFERGGYAPENLRTSVAFATPTFSWEMTEGAEAYEVQADDDPNFGSPAISVTTSRNTYTPLNTLPQGAYYWRVRARRYSTLVNDWTTPRPFTITLPAPAGLVHSPAGLADRAPTLCWQPLVMPASAQPVLAAYKYRLQVGRDPTFSIIYDTVDTEQACYTAAKGYDDGSYYWRAAMMDGDLRLGDYSTAAQLTKQYPFATLIAPTLAVSTTETPTFVWTPVDTAASYKLEVSLVPTFSPLYDSVTTNNTRYTPTKKYETGKAYYWRVAMLDKDRKQGPFSGDRVAVVSRVNYVPLVIR